MTDVNDIIKTSRTFYDNLYSTENVKNNDIMNFLDNLDDVKQLTNEEMQQCEGILTNDECIKAIKNMKPNKTPGIDGLPSDFYKKMWNTVGPLVLNSFKEGFSDGKLAESHRISILTLIFKKGDREELKNYRPISLSNIDYKILAFVLADRLQRVISSLVNNEQTAYIKNRFIGENVRLLLDIMDMSEKTQTPGILLFLDFKKAYDSLEWKFMFKALEKFGFGQDFLKWIKILYNEPRCMVKVNGFLSEKFTMQRGIRQGCPISAMLFILCTEFMALHIKQSNETNGIEIGNQEPKTTIKISQYADDTVIYLSNLQDVSRSLALVEQFSNVSGLKLNLDKTEGLCIGSLKGFIPAISEIKWPITPIRYLGIFVGNDPIELNQRNWENKLESMQKLLDSWRKRDLTLFGKITIIKSLALSSLIYSSSLLIPQTEFIKKVNKVIYHFLWNAKDRIKRKCLINDLNNGGLKMLDFESQVKSLQAAWIPRILKQENKIWTTLPIQYFNKFGKKQNILNMTFNSIESFPAIKQIPSFYQHVITSFNSSKLPKKPLNIQDLLQMQIWGNRLLKYKNKTLFSLKWINSNIWTLNDICDGHCKINYGKLFYLLRDKSDYFRIVSMILKSVSVYRHLESTKINIQINTTDQINPLYVLEDNTIVITDQKSKFFYENITKQIKEIPYQQKMWERILGDNNINWNIVYTDKLINMPDKKIAEFSYKLLMDILVCEKRLHTWKKSDNTCCIYCGENHTVKHMLFECDNVRQFWRYISNKLGIIVTYKTIIIGCQFSRDYNIIIMVLSFLLYKKWLIDRDKKTNLDIINFMKSQTKQRCYIYSQTKFSNCFNELALLSLIM